MKKQHKSVFSRYSDNEKKSLILAKESIKKLTQLGLQANPIHFILIFEWLNEKDTFLHSEIEQALQSNSYDNATAETLFINLIGQMLYHSIPSQEVESILKNLQANLNIWSSSSDHKLNLLKQEITDLSELDFPDEFKRPLTESILPTIATFISEAEELKKQVDKANEEVKILKKELERASSVSKIDGLTNLANRSGFNDILNETAQQANRDQSTFALILLDLDHFLDINETYGYLIGDSVLRYTARLIASEVGTTGSYARFDGQQFIIAIPNCTYETAAQVANSIRHKISARPLQIKSNKKTLKLSISAGLVLYQMGENIESLTDRATMQLRQAKTQGRNRVCSDA